MKKDDGTQPASKRQKGQRGQAVDRGDEGEDDEGDKDDREGGVDAGPPLLPEAAGGADIDLQEKRMFQQAVLRGDIDIVESYLNEKPLSWIEDVKDPDGAAFIYICSQYLC